MDISNAILETLSESTQPVKRTNLIAKVYQKAQRHLCNHHLQFLIVNGKIERVGMGFYQLVKN